jgi:hypothetical protein
MVETVAELDTQQRRGQLTKKCIICNHRSVHIKTTYFLDVFAAEEAKETMHNRYSQNTLTMETNCTNCTGIFFDDCVSQKACISSV